MASRTSISRDNLQSVLRIPPGHGDGAPSPLFLVESVHQRACRKGSGHDTKLIAILACESMAASRRNPGPRNPSSRKKEREGQIHDPRRNPHHQAGKLLILKRGETAQKGEFLLLRVPRLPG